MDNYLCEIHKEDKYNFTFYLYLNSENKYFIEFECDFFSGRKLLGHHFDSYEQAREYIDKRYREVISLLKYWIHKRGVVLEVKKSGEYVLFTIKKDSDCSLYFYSLDAVLRYLEEN